MSSDKVTSTGGATSSKCPDFTVIPIESLLAYVRRFELGAEKYGRDNWRKGLGDKEYVLNRLSHLINHAFILSEQLQGRTPSLNNDTEMGNVDAIVWNAAFLAVAVPLIVDGNKRCQRCGKDCSPYNTPPMYYSITDQRIYTLC